MCPGVHCLDMSRWGKYHLDDKQFCHVKHTSSVDELSKRVNQKSV